MIEADFFHTTLHGISVNSEKCGTRTEKEVQKKRSRKPISYRVRHTGNIYGTNWQHFWIFISLVKLNLSKMAISLTRSLWLWVDMPEANSPGAGLCIIPRDWPASLKLYPDTSSNSNSVSYWVTWQTNRGFSPEPKIALLKGLWRAVRWVITMKNHLNGRKKTCQVSYKSLSSWVNGELLRQAANSLPSKSKPWKNVPQGGRMCTSGSCLLVTDLVEKCGGINSFYSKDLNKWQIRQYKRP